jgi:hypothetical protein
VLEVPVVNVATVVVVLVMVTVIRPLFVDVKLVKLLAALVEVEVIEALLVLALVFEADDVLLVVEPRLVDAHVLA